MRKYQYFDTDNNVKTITGKEILESYWEQWKKEWPDSVHTEQCCIMDWRILHFAWEVEDVSTWEDGEGACKICKGELPYGHDNNCFIYTQMQKIDKLEKELKNDVQ